MADESVTGEQVLSSGTLDPEVIHGLCELGEASGEDLLSELLQMFLNDLPHRQETIAEAVSAADLTKLQREAHSLKSSSRALGAMMLGELCAALELAARLQDRERARGLLPGLFTELSVVEKTMSELLRRHTSSR
ncbi:MAG: Hpt domain-containing protein [Polyangiaceae bacterium]